ncbi:polyprenyl diphosphate synthase [Spiroplasma culicicola]|uniref:Isoprenyl transferase n=1 Tax=Spiroplasma culicicola AES-1 TaxID=1276246 RepID=W6A7G8_9MOLU|nr:polyprenyl diphosphate synthase [Spiroplasma culicicola]AHI53088.1 undecaprenyl pyrophosphate synthase [Spiroplasma culicicola AES-1]
MKKLEHVAIILDGNGRWAKQRHKPRTYGHKIGMENIFDTILTAIEHEVKFLTLFCFSTENWNRPKGEVDYLMKFPGDIFGKKNQQKYIDNGIKVNWIGRRSKVPLKTKNQLEDIENNTKELSTINVNIALDYGSYQEVENSFKIVFNKYYNQNKNINELTFDDIYNNLYTKESPKIDLLIRTGGEQRLSNFMLLQAAYAELYFTPTYWPDFNKDQFKLAIESYNKRDRRFGRIEE